MSGDNTLGSAGDCDVMLPGGDVLARHLVIHVGELVVSLQRVGSAEISLNGTDMHQPRRSAMAGDVIGLGSLELQLEQALPRAEAPDSMFADRDAEDLASPVADSRRVERGASFWTGVALLLLAIVGLVGVTLGANNATALAQGGAAMNLASVERAIRPFPEVQVEAAGAGRLAVKGFVESRLRLQELRQALRRFGQGVTVDVQAADDLVEQATRYLGDPGVAMSYAGHGRLVASGSAQDDAVRLKIRRLAEELHPLVIVSDKVQYRMAAAPLEKAAEASPAQWSAWQELLPSRLVGITEDDSGLRYVQLANGSRYYEGSMLKAGIELQRIETNGLVVSGGKPGAKESRP
jgi:type III secretion protein D